MGFGGTLDSANLGNCRAFRLNILGPDERRLLEVPSTVCENIRLPNWGDVPRDVMEELMNGSRNAKEAVYELFGITRAEQSAMGNQRKALK